MSRITNYRGMSYEQASREAERLILSGGGWFRNFEKLAALREIMEHQRLQPIIRRRANEGPYSASGVQ